MRPRLPFNLKLNIRWKFLIAMLGIAITPLLIAAWLEIRSISALGAELAADSGRAINERTTQVLVQTTRHYAEVMNRQSKTVELIVRLQAKRALIALNSSAPLDQPQGKFPWADSLVANTRSSHYIRLAEDGTPMQLPISRDNQSLFSVIKPPSAALQDSARNLLQINNFYREIQREHSDLFYWQYVALENGLLATFPGHSNYPEDFDPRQRRWYQAQKEHRALRWSAPHTDAVTGITMVNVTMPLVSKTGEFLGVSGLDVRLSGLLNALQVPLKSEYDSRVLLSVLVDKKNMPGHNQRHKAGSEQGHKQAQEIFVVAESAQQQSQRDWRDIPQLQALTLDIEGHVEKITTTVAAGRSGFLRTRWKGKDYFCLYEPLKSGDNILMMFVPIENLLDPAIRSAKHALMSTERYANALLPFAALLIAAIVFLAFIGSRRFVQPINDLVTAFNRVGEGDLDSRVEIKTGDELEQLGDAFNAVIPQLREHTKVREELSVARAVQQRLLPHESPEFRGIEIVGRTLYADQTGGDYYDFLELNNYTPSLLGIVVGDVAGHGVAAALMMATVRALLHGAAQNLKSPSAVLRHINFYLADDLHAGQFMTLFYLLFDAENCTVQWADAGHDPAIVYNPTADIFSELAGDDIPLGVDSDWRYERDQEVVLKPRDIVLLGTDGIWETKSPAGEQFGKERLRHILRREHLRPVQEISMIILTEIEKFRGGLAQHDDVSIVVFRPRQDSILAAV
jgi:phosphoserine phosphatase RsbU/P